MADTILTLNDKDSYHIEAQMERDDARKLRRLTKQLYDHIYSHYSEMEELNEMTDESLMLDIDIIEKEHEKKIAEIVKEKDSEKEIALAEKDAEIQALKEQIRQLQQKQ